ncbi:MAG: serine/threonine protein kinase [Candidatus Ozemobacter sibiricus]|uniref:non-specific serine/threonine protein kinase n=1 Tax=Candidatus Ozemobacter sibiricus TaxID=2268124 RepID=A0A367ZQ51_9BACT|nr:MAG: serine/threonine protein kinase [Candidatus Ozemobacter sibiricus]
MRKPGDVIRDRYKIVQFIGEGRHGKIYKAHDLVAGRDVSLKILDGPASADIDTVKRFIKEGEVLASLRHPAIARIYALEKDGNIPFLITEFVEGRSMAAMKDELRRDLPALFRAFEQLLDGVQECHLRQVIHRDLKPSNLLISHDGQLKIVDFGLAKTREKLTKPGVILGTPTYMSPEQCQGLPLTEASDIYSIGVIFWEFLTGKPPFEFDESQPRLEVAQLLRHVTEPLPAAAFDAFPQFAPLREIVFGMLEKTPRLRPPIPRIQAAIKNFPLPAA